MSITLRSLLINRRILLAGLALLIVAMMASCSTLRWYTQAVGGHLHILGQRKPIQTIIDDPTTSDALKKRLQLALDIRDFATLHLHLPDNNSYRQYADIGRDAPVWNVVASRPLTFEAHQWCYPFVGCLNYRGWFKRSNARNEARNLTGQDYDVLVSPAVAYSTLGWFDDPLLNTMLRYGDTQLAEFIFHELAHQQVFFKGSTAFNEAFAETVAKAGIQQWLSSRNDQQALTDWHAWRVVRQDINQLILNTRNALEREYLAGKDAEQRLRAKEHLIIQLRHQYLDELALESPESTRYRALISWREWFAQPLNNANFLLFAVYQQGVTRFEQLLECSNGELIDFYSRVAKMRDWTVAERQEWLTTETDSQVDCNLLINKQN